jgi:hypothetical protein
MAACPELTDGPYSNSLYPETSKERVYLNAPSRHEHFRPRKRSGHMSAILFTKLRLEERQILIFFTSNVFAHVVHDVLEETRVVHRARGERFETIEPVLHGLSW